MSEQIPDDDPHIRPDECPKKQYESIQLLSAVIHSYASLNTDREEEHFRDSTVAHARWLSMLEAHDAGEKVEPPKSALNLAWRKLSELIDIKLEDVDLGYWHFKPDQVEKIAEFALRDALFGKEWLEAWLASTNYPTPNFLIEKYYPSPNALLNTKTMHNFGAVLQPEYKSDDESVNELRNALDRQLSLIAVMGQGGIGKSSLIYEVGQYFARKVTNRFAHVIWFQLPLRADQEGALQRFISVIRTELHSYGSVDFSKQVDLKAFEKASALQPVLYVVNSLDVTSDEGREILDWLHRLPAPSKAIVALEENTPDPTIQIYLERGGIYLYRLSSTVRPQAIDQSLAHEIGERYPRYVDQLISLVGNNPNRWEMMRIFLKSNVELRDEPTFEVIAAPAFGECWQDENMAAILLALIPFELQANLEPLLSVAAYLLLESSQKSASLTANEKSTAKKSIQEKLRQSLKPLIDKGLIEPLYRGDQDSNVLNAQKSEIVRLRWAEAIDRLSHARLKDSLGLSELLYCSWIDTYCEIAESVGYCPYNHAMLKGLDPEINVLTRVITYVRTQFARKDLLPPRRRYYAEQIQRLASCTYYYYVRGYYATLPSPHLLAAEAAQEFGWDNLEAFHRTFELEWNIKRKHMDGIEALLARLNELEKSAEIKDETRVIYLSTMGYYLLTTPPHTKEKNDEAKALLERAIELGQQPEIDTPHRFGAMLRLTIHYAQDASTRPEAINLLGKYIEEAETKQDLRIATAMRLLSAETLIKIASPEFLRYSRNLFEERITDLLEKVERGVKEIEDKTQEARLAHARGQHYALRHDFEAALKYFHLALELFQEIGRHILAEEVQTRIMEVEKAQKWAPQDSVKWRGRNERG